MTTAEAKGQCTAEQLKTMSAEEIVKAQQDGRLDSLLGRGSKDLAGEAS
ncbi:hypothetical protein [Arthrobacter cavernae]|uniref:Uncharacterized protein n=1 Tax=Arthrobacter cavernae TaxID=2817681 RepID=A0A939HKQ2_9MICC|nr:hypothetical protein [Arthrobacter cavernae]MBO1269606.1 hypothetical protein [Arthrobacter cavernae]